jgi:hypothetical protein
MSDQDYYNGVSYRVPYQGSADKPVPIDRLHGDDKQSAWQKKTEVTQSRLHKILSHPCAPAIVALLVWYGVWYGIVAVTHPSKYVDVGGTGVGGDVDKTLLHRIGEVWHYAF